MTKADGENSLILHDRKAVSTAAAVAVVVVLLVVAAAAAYYVFYYQTSSSSSSSSSSTTTGPLPGKGMSVGVVFDIGGIGDRGFNELAYDGMLQANSTLGVDYKYEVATQTSLIPNLFATLIGDHLNLIVGIGFDMDSAIAQYSAQYPNQKFAQVDGDIYNITNVVAIKYQEHIGSAIVGALAAAMAGNGQKIGFLGGVTTGIIYKFWNGWKAGA
ncbi:MAG TPA: BMP family ABC transporter substrate-binding protein, partial [Nitrososphaerales archaeon]|nr:BMP family ABC transporter substrate-binding protein [Nitrososphaerales archaeon]